MREKVNVARRLRSIYGKNDPRVLPAYGVREAAHQLRLPPATLRYWVTAAKSPLIVPARRRPLALSFWNLVEAQVLASIRREHRVSMPRVRRAIDYVKTQLGLREHPLVHQAFETDGVDLFVREYAQGEGRDSSKLVVASEGGQLALGALMRGVLERVERDDSGLVLRLHPFIRDVHEPKHVVVDPSRAFARPCVTGTSIPVDVIAERFAGGDTIERLSSDYRLDPSVVLYAIQWGVGARSA